MVYYIDQRNNKNNTAGAKAPDDIIELCKRRKYKGVVFPPFPANKSTLYKKLWTQIIVNLYWLRLFFSVRKGDVIIYQHPAYGQRTTIPWVKRISEKGCRTVALIHDLESLRGGIKDIIKTNKVTEIGDNKLLQCFDRVICHNKYMKRYLEDIGFSPEKLISLDLFDYITECEPIDTIKSEQCSIAIAGNLAMGKSGYIYKIKGAHNRNLIINLYGIRYEDKINDKRMVYHGSFKPDELPAYLEGRYGLVWDGLEADTCSGNTGEYLKYNNPHKTSLYLAAGMPVVIWNKAALAELIQENNLGIAIDSLYKLEETIKTISSDDYCLMRNNVLRYQKLVRQGFFFYKALDEAMK